MQYTLAPVLDKSKISAGKGGDVQEIVQGIMPYTFAGNIQFLRKGAGVLCYSRISKMSNFGETRRKLCTH